MSRIFDIVVFGASGYTGQYVVELLAKFAKGDGIAWTVAGRSRSKLLATLETVSEWVGNGRKLASEVEPIVADVEDAQSLATMCKTAKVVIDCAGPYLLYGEQVVKAAIENGASYVDFTGEEIFMAKMQLKYNELAKKSKVYIVSACGYDSIPAELGVQFLRDHTPSGDRLTTVDLFIKQGGPQGTFNHGTWDSMVGIFSSQKETKDLRRQLFKDRMPKIDAPPAKKVYFSELVKRWVLLTPTPDMSVSQRTQLHNFVEHGEQPVRMTTYFTFKTLPQLIGMALGMAFIFLMASFNYGRTLLLDYPEIFSAGRFSKKGPQRDIVLKRKFEQYYEGRLVPSGKRIVGKCSGPDMAYVTCAASALESAMVILKEQDKLPAVGGVFPPGAAFAKTTLRQRLERHGLKYEMLQS